MENGNKGKNQVIRMNYLRAIATLVVVFAHTLGSDIGDHCNSVFINLIQLSTRWVLPIFVMIAGASILPPQRIFSYKINFERIKYIITIVFIWGSVYTLLSLYFIHGEKQLSVVLPKTIKMILTADVSRCCHFWYLYMLLGLYIFTPVLRIFIAHAKQKDIEYYLLASIIISFCLPLLLEVFFKDNPNMQILRYFTFLSGYPVYYVMGYYLNSCFINKIWINLFKILAVLLFSIYFTGMLKLHDVLIYSCDEALTLYQFALACLVFETVNQAFVENRFMKKIYPMMVYISKYSLGIYIFHPLVVGLLRKVVIKTTFMPISISISFLIILAVFIPIIIVVTLQKIPFFKKIV